MLSLHLNYMNKKRNGAICSFIFSKMDMNIVDIERKILFLAVFLCHALIVFPQDLKVRCVEETPNDLTARTQEKLDVKGNASAVIKVGIPLGTVDDINSKIRNYIEDKLFWSKDINNKLYF